jgi:hypothetical protein
LDKNKYITKQKQQSMKKLFSLFMLLLIISSAYGQFEIKKLPKSDPMFNIGKSPNRHIDFLFPDKEKSIEALIENASPEKIENLDFSFALINKFNLDFKDIIGDCDSLTCIKSINFKSQGALTLSFIFKNLELNEGSELFIISDKHNYIQGPITNKELTINHEVISTLIPGDEVRIVLKYPLNSKMSEVQISKASHGVFDFFGINSNKDGRTLSGCFGFGCSAPCNQNIICEASLTEESKAVALLIATNETTQRFMGSGALINNGNQDYRPIMLIAAHEYNTLNYPYGVQFVFHYRSPQCSPNTIGPNTFFVQGANSLSSTLGRTDSKLIELMANPRNSTAFVNNPVSWLGWSIIDEQSAWVKIIGHPAGDVQKLLIGGPPEKYDHYIYSNPYYYWRFQTTQGMPIQTISGSPVLNDQKRIIGPWSGRPGTAPLYSCEGPNFVWAGRLSSSWHAFCQYLDPNNEGITALNTISTAPGTKTIPQIVGPYNLCSSGLYNLLNAPLDLPVSWEIIQGANLLSGITSGSGKSVTLNVLNQSVSGLVRIRYTVQNLCSTKQYIKNLWVGKPAAPGGIQGGAQVYSGQISNYSIPVSQGATHYLWQVPSGWSGGGLLTSNIANLTVGSTSGNIIVTPQNACGNSLTSSSLYVTVNSCQFCRSIEVWPNPANDYLSLLASENSEGRIDLEKDLKGYVIYDVQGKMVANQEKTRKINPNAIEVSGLIPGIYVIHLILETEIVTKRVIIER